MKKIILTICCLFIVQNLTFGDEIIDSKGTIIPCEIETVTEGFIEYKKDGNLYTFIREGSSPIFNDYVDARQKLFDKTSIIRYSGKIIVKDMWSVIIQNGNENIDIPFYRIKFIGIYKPE
jgi:hypothetical protein